MGDDALAASIILAHICFGVTYLDKLDQAFEWAEEQMKKPWLYKSPLQGSRNNKKQYKTT
jgi:hypothetical protein